MDALTATKVARLLPRLGAKTDKHRLKILDQIECALAEVGAEWSDLAEGVQPTFWHSASLVAAVEKIEARPDLLNSQATKFLATLRRLAERADPVRLSVRQRSWLDDLIWKAERPMREISTGAFVWREMRNWRGTYLDTGAGRITAQLSDVGTGFAVRVNGVFSKTLPTLAEAQAHGETLAAAMQKSKAEEDAWYATSS